LDVGMKRLLLAPLVLLAGLVLAPIGIALRAEDAATAAPRTVILVRHGEKEASPKDPRDPSLSELGAARARELARLLGSTGATKCFTSELKRTQETVAPLAQVLGVTSEPLPAAKSEVVVAALDALAPGTVAVVCGHSNTVPRLAELLGAPLAGTVVDRGVTMLPDDAYDRVFVITRPASGPASCVELRYGAPAAAIVSSGK